MRGSRHPRLLAEVHLVRSAGGTLLTVGERHARLPVGAYDAIAQLAPLLDGSTSTGQLLELLPASRRPMAEALLDRLVELGAVRPEERPRPPGLRDDLLALADRAGADSYARCERFAAATVSLRAPVSWLAPLTTGLLSVGLRPTTQEGPDIALGLDDRVTAVRAGDEWLAPDVRAADRSVLAGALVAEAVTAFFGLPTPPRPAPGRVPGLDRSAPQVTAGAPLLDPWPDPATLRDLLTDPASLLPRREEGLARPASVRELAHVGPGTPAVRLPAPVEQVLRGLHVPLRWESGGLAHNGACAHRGIASARALYPVELYVLGEAGAWYVEPGDLRLVPTYPGTTAPPATYLDLVLTVRETKVAWRYHRYAGRLCLQEAGLAMAALREGARAAGLAATHRVTLGDRGADDPLGARLALAADERVVGEVRLEPHTHGGGHLDDHLELVRRRRSGHHLFNSLGRPGTVDLGGLPARLVASLEEPLGCLLVAHRRCASTLGDLEPGCYEVSPAGLRLLDAGDGPTRVLQAGQEHMGWLAPDYASAAATVVVTAPEDRAVAGLAQLHELTAAAAVLAHAALLAAAERDLAGRIHNSLRVETLRTLTRREDLALFQVLVGDPAPDGTLCVALHDPTEAAEHAAPTAPTREEERHARR